jgi:hypothetical protein
LTVTHPAPVFRSTSLGCRGDLEPVARVEPARVLDHSRGQVDPADVDAETGQVRSHVPRSQPTSDICVM